MFICFRRKTAFTLIEIMVVIAIIGIIAGISIPSYLNSKAEANLTACEQNLKSIAVAYHTYMVRHNVYDNGRTMRVADLVDLGYLGSLPTCPTTGTFTYNSMTYDGYAKGNLIIWCTSGGHQLAGVGTKYKYTGGQNTGSIGIFGPGIDIYTGQIIYKHPTLAPEPDE